LVVRNGWRERFQAGVSGGTSVSSRATVFARSTWDPDLLRDGLFFLWLLQGELGLFRLERSDGRIPQQLVELSVELVRVDL
jgi:hypothetical protein